jgi:poly(beta-D-mannuronate) lyase
MTDAHSLVEHNLFVKCNGENETISNKSGGNVYRYNTFRDSVGELTLRHGNHCEVYGNFFFNTHGLRFFGDDHRIYSNYFENCNPAIQIGNGDTIIPPGQLTGHDQPERVRILFNTLVNNKQNVVMPGRKNGLGAVDLVFANNIIESESGAILNLNGGPLVNPEYEGNIVWGAAANGDLPEGGFRRVNPQLIRDAASGIFRLSLKSPAINAAIGSYGEVVFDIDGAKRAGRKDVGADEFSDAAFINRPLTTEGVGPFAR